MAGDHLSLSTPTPPVEMPRGRMITAAGILRRWFLDAETDEPMVSVRWIRQNMPYKQQLSHSRVAWYENDVAAVIAEARRTGKPIREVKLSYLESAA